MDDLEFRRRILSEPKFRDNEIHDTINLSEANSKFADEVLSLDAQIEQAMKVDVPDELADRILFSQNAQKETKSFTKQMVAMAASVAFAAGILIGQINWAPLLVSPAYASLVNTAMKHVVDETPFIEKLDERVSSTQINAKLQPFTYEFTESFPYHVFYLNHCGFGESNALHMVFQGKEGRVTLFITNILSSQAIDFNKNGMTGVVIPIDNASMILVGQSAENVQEIASRLSTIIKPIL